MRFRLFLRCSALVAAGLIGSPPGVSAATTVIGTVKDASGTVLSSGLIIFTLSQEGIVSDPALLITPPVTCTITAGVIQSCSLRGNDEISPAGTVYRVRITSSGGRTFLPERTYSITGATWDIGTQTPNPSSVQTGIHGASLHSGDVIPPANQELGAFYFDFAQIAVPANPTSGTRRLFVDSVTGEVSVRTSAGSTVSLEAGGGAGATHQIDGVALTTQNPINFLDTSEFDWTNPAAGNYSLALKAASVADSKLASNYSGVGSCTNQFVRATVDNAAPTCETVSLTADVTGTLPVGNGGTGAGAFTLGSVVFAGASGVYTQDNTNFFWDDTTNRLGIGTASPSTPIEISATSSSMKQTRWSDAAGSGAGIVIQRSRGATVGADTIVQDGDHVAALNFRGYDGNDFTSQVARISAFVDGTPGLDDMPGRLVFFTTPAGASIALERLRITNSGTFVFEAGAVDPVITISSSVFNLSTGVLQQGGTPVVLESRTLTIAGTANEITSSAGAQDLSTDRTWTLSLPTTIDLGGKTSFEIPNAAAPVVDAFGEIAGDNDFYAASRGVATFFDGTSATHLVGVLNTDTPTNGQVPTWNTGGTITWETSGGADGVGYDEVLDEGTGLTKRAQINFIGGGVSCVDNAGSTRTDCTIAGGGTSHEILSGTHTDTTAATVVRGDLMTGQLATPKWQRLALGASGQVLRSDGTDALWATLAQGDLPAAIAYEDEANIFTVAGGLTMDNQLGLRLRELTANGTNYIEHRAVADAGAGNTTYTWPATTDSRFLFSGTAGALSWNQASGVGACGANNFVTGSNNNAVPTCAQPAFSNLTGSATDGQVPDNITIATQDNNFSLLDDLDNTKVLAFQLSSITTGTTRTVTVPDANGEMSLLGQTIDDGELTSNYSGVGSCTNQFVRATVDNAAPTCATVGTADITNNAITDALLRDSAATSIIGRSAASTGDPADIAASADGQVLRRAAGSLGFGALDLADTDAVTGLLPDANIAASLSRDTEAPGAADIGGSLSAGYTINAGAVASPELATANKTFVQPVVLFDSTGLLDADDIPSVFRPGRAITITEVWCETDAGTPSVNLQRDDGTPADVLSSNLTCTTGGATGTIAGAEDNVAATERIDFVMVSASTAKRISLMIKYTVD